MTCQSQPCWSGQGYCITCSTEDDSANPRYHGSVRSAPALFVAALLSFPASSTRADDRARAEADALAERGYDLAQARKLEPAIEAFKQALTTHPRAVYLCNIGLAYGELGRPHRAHWFLSQCLRRWSETEDAPIDARVTEYINAATDALERGAYGRMRLLVEPGDAIIAIPSAFAADERVEARQPIWLPEGNHSLRITRDGFRPLEVTLQIARGASHELSYALEPVPRPVAVVDRPPRRASRGIAAPVAVTSIGVALLVAGGVAHMVALDRKGAAKGLPAGDAFEEARRTYDRWRFGAIGLYAAGALTAGLGTLWLRSRLRGPARPTQVGGAIAADEISIMSAWEF